MGRVRRRLRQVRQEIDREISQRKFTLAELEEEEQSLDRLRRWHRTIKTRDLFGASSAAEAHQQLKHCQDRLADYTERVWRSTCFRGRLCAGQGCFRLRGRMFGVSRVK